MTSSLPLLIPTALALGALHAFGPDHIAAVSVFVSRRPSWRHAFGLGARWGLGHSLTVVVVGGVLAVAGLRLPERFAPLAERVVGVTLIVIGLFAVVRALRLHGHWHEHGDVRHWHVHSHRTSEGHEHDHGALLGIGMLHGLAGTGALVVALPVAVAGSATGALIFLIAFGIGTIVAMSLVSAAAGWVLGATTRASVRLHRSAIVLAGSASMLIGVWWVIAGGG
jgi:sulfite exporter TauE/SafE